MTVLNSNACYAELFYMDVLGLLKKPCFSIKVMHVLASNLLQQDSMCWPLSPSLFNYNFLWKLATFTLFSHKCLVKQSGWNLMTWQQCVWKLFICTQIYRQLLAGIDNFIPWPWSFETNILKLMERLLGIFFSYFISIWISRKYRTILIWKVTYLEKAIFSTLLLITWATPVMFKIGELHHINLTCFQTFLIFCLPMN